MLVCFPKRILVSCCVFVTSTFITSSDVLTTATVTCVFSLLAGIVKYSRALIKDEIETMPRDLASRKQQRKGTKATSVEASADRMMSAISEKVHRLFSSGNTSPTVTSFLCSKYCTTSMSFCVAKTQARISRDFGVGRTPPGWIAES